MEVVVRKIEIRGEDEYIVDIRGGLPMEKQLDILLQASYNTILTSSEFAKKENSANSIKDMMWKFLMDYGQKEDISVLKEYVYDLIKMTTQKTSGQKRTVKNDISWEELDMTIMSIVIEATCLVLSGRLDELEQSEEE